MTFWRLGLLGYPLDHSRSPALHQAALRALGWEGEYRLYPVRPTDAAALQAWVARVRTGQVHGLNVTIPHKTAVARLVDRLTPAAQATGAVNTLYRAAGQVVGDNTDAAGFWADARARLPLSDPTAWRGLVLGAGGAARAVAYALARAGMAVWVVARRPAQAQALVRALAPWVIARLTPTAWDALPRLVAQPGPAWLIVNATPVGMAPHGDASPWPATAPWPRPAAVYDLVYAPRPTRLVHQARAAGLPAADGLGMLVEQAARAFVRWTAAAYEPVRAAMLRAAGLA